MEGKTVNSNQINWCSREECESQPLYPTSRVVPLCPTVGNSSLGSSRYQASTGCKHGGTVTDEFTNPPIERVLSRSLSELFTVHMAGNATMLKSESETGVTCTMLTYSIIGIFSSYKQRPQLDPRLPAESIVHKFHALLNGPPPYSEDKRSST
ncbi:5478_t:CDS:2 [Acaulospora morrowiae]|uniref:5478_t:CDS:1 n=1 Tax=Acaulospora morrowiae TaxID=94023 RepID=A0A9N8VE03_9GLOM|nr:5478_t:CDS:2 [Acaulospora morrowiae]